MGKKNYLGGHTVWNGRHSAPENWGDGPAWQSRKSAELLGSSDPLIVKFGERLYELEMHIGFALDSIKTYNDPKSIDDIFNIYFNSPCVNKSRGQDIIKEEFLFDIINKIDSIYENLKNLQIIMKYYIEYSSDTNKYRNHIENIVKNKREF